jgi:hypothetical protein
MNFKYTYISAEDMKFFPVQPYDSLISFQFFF